MAVDEPDVAPVTHLLQNTSTILRFRICARFRAGKPDTVSTPDDCARVDTARDLRTRLVEADDRSCRRMRVVVRPQSGRGAVADRARAIALISEASNSTH